MESQGEVLDVCRAGGIRVGQARSRLEPLVGHERDDLLDEGVGDQGASRSWVSCTGAATRVRMCPLGSKGWATKRRTSGGRLGHEWWNHRAAPWSIAHVRPCQTRRFGLAHVRSTFAV